MFPAASVAVYVTAVVPAVNKVPGVCDFVHTKLPEAVQLSVADGSVQETMEVHIPGSLDLVIFAGHPEIIGF
jgi:hypothetical protein